MLYRFISYARFLSSSTNQHGVHSPFIYAYVTKGLYAKSSAKGSKAQRVLLKSIAYFRPKKIYLDTNRETLTKEIMQQLAFKAIGNAPYDLVYLSKPKQLVLERLIKAADVHNDSVILIDGIHATKAATAQWEAIKKWKGVRVSIDMFYCGAIFVRKDQVKQHFKIRI